VLKKFSETIISAPIFLEKSCKTKAYGEKMEELKSTPEGFMGLQRRESVLS
jgi:hypothetical protein